MIHWGFDFSSTYDSKSQCQYKRDQVFTGARDIHCPLIVPTLLSVSPPVSRLWLVSTDEVAISSSVLTPGRPACSGLGVQKLDVNMMVNNQGFISLISISLLFEWINASMQCDAMDHSKESAWKMINLHFLAHYLLVGPVILMQYFQTKLLLPAQHKGVLIYLWQHNEHWQLHAVTNKDRYANMRHRKK